MNKFFKGFGYAFNGLGYAIKTQLNFKVHIVAAIFIIALGAYFKLSATEWCWLAVAVTLVVVVELLNTAIEILTDMVSPGYNEKAGRIKDIAAAAVLIAALFAAIVGGIIFIPKF